MANATSRTRLYFKHDGSMRAAIHPRKGEGARTQGQLLDLILPAQADRRIRTLVRVARIYPKVAAAYRERDPAVKNGAILSLQERIAEDSPSRSDLFVRVDQIVGDGVFEREEIVQQIVLWLLDGSVTWRTFLRNRRQVMTSAKRWLKKRGVIYDSYGTISLDAPLGEDGLTLGDVLEG